MNTLALKIIGSASIFTILTLTACDKQSPSAEAASAPPAAPTPAAQSQAKSAKTYDGPLGLDMGISIAELTKDLGFTLVDDQSASYTGTPPKPSDLFVRYYVRANNHSGLCNISAFTKIIEFNDSGDQIKQQVDEIAKALAIKYGKGALHDYVTSTLYKKPEFWALAAEDKTAVYGYQWDKKQLENTSKNLSSITIEAMSNDLKTGTVRAVYFFKNQTDCENEITAKQSNNL